MTVDEIKQIFAHNPTNKYIVARLDDNALGIIADILSNVDSNDFKEINPNGQFDLTDIPIPYELLDQKENAKPQQRSEEIDNEINTLLEDINKEGSNFEYPYAFNGQNGSISNIEKMPAGERQACQYDWSYINDFIKNNDNAELNLFHTHPKPIGQEHNTLFNKYPDQLSALGVKPQGLNISVSDLYAQMYLEGLVKQSGKNISTQSTILMHDGALVSFSTQNGINLTENKKLERSQIKEEQTEIEEEQTSLSSQTNINEFGEIVRSNEEIKQEIDQSIPTFTPPTQENQATIEKVPLEVIREVQKELFPETYGKDAQKIVIEKYEKIIEEENQLNKNEDTKREI